MGAVTPTIYCNNAKIDGSYQVISIDVRREVNRIPFAELRLLDGSAAAQSFPISETDLFAPGSTIKLQARRESDTTDQVLFEGIVVRHAIEASAQGSTLIVGCKDVAVQLTGVRTSAVYPAMADGDIIAELLKTTQVKKGTFATTSVKHPDMVQFDCTPWDFIISRADALGLLVVVEDGTLSLAAMELGAGTPIKLGYGINQIYSVELEADAESQIAAVQSVAWDPNTQKMTTPVSASDVSTAPGNFVPKTLASAMKNSKRTLTALDKGQSGELQTLADSRMARSRMAMVRGRMSVAGFAPCKLLTPVTLAGLGKRFNGKTMITGVRHQIDRDGWNTDLQFGLSPEEFITRPNVSATPATGMLPPISGLQIGKVVSGDDDTKEPRVKVILPGISAKTESAVWARFASFDAGKDHGAYFRPQKDDEVVVGFLNGDPRCPVILGSLYSSGIPIPAALGKVEEKNLNRGLVSKLGTTLGFIEDKKAKLLLKMPSGAQLLLDDDKEEITLSDKHGNEIKLDKNGIALASAKKFTVDAKDAVTIKGSKVDVQ